MKIIFRFFLFYLFCIQTSGQSYIYKNDFTDPLINEKPSFSDGNRIELKDGFLFCEQQKSNFYWCIAERIFIDTQKDFEIEMKLKAYQTDPLFSEFGLLFGLKNVNMFNSFLINSMGEVSISSKVYDSEIPFISSLPLQNYKNGDWCTFKLINKDGRMYFYINNELVYERKKIDMMGRWFGWYTNGETGIQIDYFNVKQERGEIVLSPEYDEYKKERLKKVNSDKDEVNPMISEDGRNLFFARFINSSTSFYTVCKDGILGFYSCQSDTGGNPSVPEKIKIPIKNSWYIGSNPKQNSFFAGEKDNHFTSSGYQLAKCNFNSGSIDASSSIKFNGFNNISIRHAHVSRDGNIMVISGYENYEPNGLDLYVSFKSGALWTLPKKISTLNTKGDEVTPYISADGKRIYFSSDGHSGYGFTDVFVAERLDESWMKWSGPVNMGKGINDAAFNEFFVMPDSTNSEYAYMSSSYGNINNLDLFKVRIKKKRVREQEFNITVMVRVQYPEKTKEKLNSLTAIINNEPDKSQRLDLIKDEFIFTIGKNEIFSLQPNDTDFVILEKKTFEKKGLPQIIEVVLKVAKIKRGESFVLENIYFTANNFDLLSTSHPALDALAQSMLNNPKLKIEIQGHTSKTNETEQFNLNLSTQRAKAVKKYLSSKGIPDERMIAKGYGYTQPRYTDDSTDHQAANRRVEIKILEK